MKLFTTEKKIIDSPELNLMKYAFSSLMVAIICEITRYSSTTLHT